MTQIDNKSLNSIQIRHIVPLDDRRVSVGPWDWEAFEAHKRGTSALSQSDIMKILKRPERVEALQQEAKDDAVSARRLCIVIDNFFSESDCDDLVERFKPLLRTTASSSLRNLVHKANDGDDGSTQKLLTSVSDRLWTRLRELMNADDEACRSLQRELQIAPEWSCRDYHVRSKERGVADIEMRLNAMSDNVRAMLYSAPAEAREDQQQRREGATGEEPRVDEGDFATDPRNAHHDGRNRRPAGDSFLTALLYLNSEGERLEGEGEDAPLEGGRTLFLNDDGRPVGHVAPRKGSLLLFDHHLYHRGESVTRGAKFCLRSDLLYVPCDAQTGEERRELME